MNSEGETLERVKAFLECLFPVLTNEIVIDLRCYRDGPQGPRHACRTVDEVLERAGALKERWNVYFCVGACRLRPGRRIKAKKSDIAYSRVLFADIDTYKFPNAKERLKGLPRPSYAVHSGQGWHVYWLLREPFWFTSAADIERYEAMNRGLTRHLGTDNIWNLNHILRVPGTLNHKAGGPYPVSLREPSQ